MSAVLRRSFARLQWAMIVGALTASLALLKQPGVPLRDPAFFAYIGRLIKEGLPLYRTVWDDKLPSIYYVNALGAALLPNYRAQLIADGVLNVVSIVLFAELLALAGVRRRLPAIVVFAVGLNLLPTLFGHTEFYAVACILGGLVAWRRGAGVLSGALLALATTFWIPAALTVIAVIAVSENRRSRIAVAAGYALFLGAYGVAFFAAFRGEALGVVHSWLFYAGAHNAYGASHTLRAIGSRLLLGATQSAVASLLAVVLAVVHRPIGWPQRLGLWWSACALAGAATSENFFSHYFLPSLAPLIFTIAVFAQPIRAARPSRRIGQALLAGLALLLFHRSVNWAIHDEYEIYNLAVLEAHDGSMIANHVGRATALLVENAYDPAFYLGADARPVSRFDVIAPANRAFFASLPTAALPNVQKRAEQTVVIIRRDTPGASIAPALDATGFVEVCAGRNVPWKLLVRIRDAAAFRSCDNQPNVVAHSSVAPVDDP